MPSRRYGRAKFSRRCPAWSSPSTRGEGKANQYFLRGFNLDHGTDLAISVDGMPVNMRTHGHGQGYADINFLIPELVEAMRVRKGPYFADEGDFASAGAVHIDISTALPNNLAAVTIGSFGYSAPARHRLDSGRRRHPAGRGRSAASTTGRGTCRTTCASSTACCATARARAPTASRSPAWPTTTAGTRPTRSPQRAIDQGLIGRFGYARPDRRRQRQSLQPVGRFSAHQTTAAVTKLEAYAIRYDAEAVQQLHLFPRRSGQRRPVQPDRQPQHPRLQRQPAPSERLGSGLRRRDHASACRRATTTSTVGLFNTVQRDVAIDRARRRRQRRQRRRLCREHDALDRLAAHHVGVPRRLLSRQRRQRQAGQLRQGQRFPSPARSSA